MDEGGGVERESSEISLLADELIQLSIEKSLVVPSDKPTLICSVWTKKHFNTESLRAQLKSIWKTKRKFDIQMVGQNLFLIVFDLEEDLESIMEGRPWLFRKFLILFDRLINPIERDLICLTSSPYWIKIGPCPPEFDKKDLLHAIGSTFGGVLRSEISGDWCRLRVNLDVQKPLRRGIFVSSDNSVKSWIPFKFEKLPVFYFSCGRLDHGLNDCKLSDPAEKIRTREDPPYSIALKAESKVTGKESMKFNTFVKKQRTQSNYIGQTKGDFAGGKILAKWEEGLQDQEESLKSGETERLNARTTEGEGFLEGQNKTYWKRLPVKNHLSGEQASIGVKRKHPEEGEVDECSSLLNGDKIRRLRYADMDDKVGDCMEVMIGGCQWASRPDAMKNISWNVRGLGSPRAVRRLRHLCKQFNPQMVFLMETKLDQKRMERVRRSCGFVNGINIATEGSRGGLCLAWKVDFEVTLKSFSKWHIDTIIRRRMCRRHGKNLAWSTLKNLAQGCDYPWLVAGDFNEIMYSFEKRGGLPRDHR
ncbi:reverse transcriptase [Gossypium australe]|uniref:Reverse transcriptase n=1 Tax=Gossypium australe TaxID=47621 RepID=A0A5B6VNJ4_9ROSI|nr:reverse transcriptase [Gossypium australe]